MSREQIESMMQNDIDNYNTTYSSELSEFLEKVFSEDTEVFETFLYVLSTFSINDAQIIGLSGNKNETKVSPMALRLCRRFESGLVKNEFFMNNYAVIKVKMHEDEIKINSASYILRYANEKEGKYRNTESQYRYYYENVKAILLSRVDVFTTLALLWRGSEFTESFDAQMRSLNVMSKEHEEMFKKAGVF